MLYAGTTVVINRSQSLAHCTTARADPPAPDATSFQFLHGVAALPIPPFV